MPGQKDAAPVGANVPSEDEWLTDVHFEFAVLGIDGWIDWPLDRVKLFLIEKSERDGDRWRQALQLEQRRGKRFPAFFFASPLP